MHTQLSKSINARQDMVAATRETRRLSYAAAAEENISALHGRHEQRQRAAEQARIEEAEEREREEREKAMKKAREEQLCEVMQEERLQREREEREIQRICEV